MKKIIIIAAVLFSATANAQSWINNGGLKIVDGTDTLAVPNVFSKYTGAFLREIRGNVGVSTNTDDTVLVFDKLTKTIKKKLVSGGGGTTYTNTAPIVVSGNVISADTAKAQGKLATFNDIRINNRWDTTSNDIFNKNTGKVLIGTSAATGIEKVEINGDLLVGGNTQGIKFKTLNTFRGLWFDEATPTLGNSTILKEGNTTAINATQNISLRAAGDFTKTTRVEVGGILWVNSNQTLSETPFLNEKLNVLGGAHLRLNAPSQLGLSIQASAAHTEDLIRVVNSANASLFRVNNTGNLYVASLATGLTPPLTTGATRMAIVDQFGMFSSLPLPTSGWGLTGNAGTDTSINFIGTTDLKPLSIRTNGIERFKVNSNGLTDFKGGFRITNTTVNPTSGEGLNFFYNNELAQIFPYNHSTSTLKKLEIRARNLLLAGDTIITEKLQSTGAISISGALGLGQGAQNGSGTLFYDGGDSTTNLISYKFSNSSYRALRLGAAVTFLNQGGFLIGNQASDLDASAISQINSTTKGFLPPRLTTTQINSIVTPANGLTVYNTTLSTLCFYNGTTWQKVTTTAM